MSPHPDTESPAPLTIALQTWATEMHGATARVAAVQSLDGHAGNSFRFDVKRADAPPHELVIRLAPPSRRSGSPADVLRQVPLLTALDAAGFPVAPVIWSSVDDHPFGTDALIQHRFGATSIDMFRSEPATQADIDTNRGPWQHAIGSLARLHQLDWQAHLGQWARPQQLDDIFELIRRILAKAPEPAWADQGHTLLDALSRHLTQSGPIGLMHGDFQTNNILFNSSGEVVAVVDWELADIGPLELDLGWAAMMTDPDAWHPDLSSRLRVQVEPQDVFAWYGAAPTARLWSFYALACLRYGAIASYNIRLSRSGHRPDAFNDSMATTIPVLFRRGLDVLRRTSHLP